MINPLISPMWDSFPNDPQHYTLKCNRIRKDWDIYELIIDLLSNEKANALESERERTARQYILSC